MFKNLTIPLTLSMIFISGAYAGGPEIPPPARLGDFNGVYIGMHAGALQGTVDNEINSTLSAGALPVLLQQTESAYDSIFKMVGGIQFGWGHEFNVLYLGFDIDGTYQNFNITNRYEIGARTTATGNANATITTVSKLETSYGIDFHPGVLISPAVLLYGKVGVLRSLFKVTSTTDTTVETGGGGSIIVNNSASENTYGLLLALGIETKASQHVGLGVEYQYTSYPNLRAVLQHSPGSVFNSVNNFVNNSITTSGVLFNVNYYFNDVVERQRLWAHYEHGGFNGLYLGVHGGIRKGSLKFSLRHESVTSSAAGSFNFQTQEAQSDSAGGFIGLQLGYGHVFKWFYLGVDALGSFQQIHVEGANLGLSATTLTPAFTINTETGAILDGTYGIDVRPGVVVSPAVLLYVRVGAERTRIRMQAFTKIEASGAGAGSFFVSNPEELTGLRLGVGVETKLSKHVGMNLEYLYTTYDKFSINGSTATPIVFSNSTNYTLRTEGFLVGFNYFFN